MKREFGSDRRRQRVMALPLLLGLAGVVLAACGDDSVSTEDSSTTGQPRSGGASATAQDLENRTFLSASVTGHDLVDDSVIRVSFEDARLIVAAGCNTISGEYRVDDTGTLAFTGTPMTTVMGCEDALMAQDAWLTDLFTEGVAASVDANALTLSSGPVEIAFDEETDAGVLGTTWTLTSLVRGDAVSSLPAGVDAPTLEIADDGTTNVFTGCNTGGSTVTVGDSTLTFEPMRLTMMACEGDATEVEATVTVVLDGEVDFEVDGKMLTLTKGDQGLVFTAE